MTSYLAAYAALAVASTLIIAAALHIYDRHGLDEELRMQGTLPMGLIAPVRWALVACELLLGVSTAAALGAGAMRLALAASAVMFAAFAVYTAYLLHTRPGTPCACGDGSPSVSPWTVARAASLAAAACYAAVLLDAGGLDGSEIALAASAGVATALIAWSLPGCLAEPRARGSEA